MDFKGFCFRISKERGRVLQCEDRCQCRRGVAAGCRTPTGGSDMYPLFSDFPCVWLIALCAPVSVFVHLCKMAILSHKISASSM